LRQRRQQKRQKGVLSLAPWAAHFVYAFELPKEARQVQLSSRFADENAVIIAIEINTLVVFGLCLFY
jgi:hypothetical protein